MNSSLINQWLQSLELGMDWVEEELAAAKPPERILQMPHSKDILHYSPLYEQTLREAQARHQIGEHFELQCRDEREAKGLRLKFYAFAKRLREINNPLGEAAAHMILVCTPDGKLRFLDRMTEPGAQILQRAGIKLDPPKLHLAAEESELLSSNPMRNFEDTMARLGYGGAPTSAQMQIESTPAKAGAPPSRDEQASTLQELMNEQAHKEGDN